MGYFKNETISMEVEVGDRLPEPKRASEHVSEQWQQTRELSARVERFAAWQRNKLILLSAFCGFAAGVLTLTLALMIGGV